MSTNSLPSNFAPPSNAETFESVRKVRDGIADKLLDRARGIAEKAVGEQRPPVISKIYGRHLNPALHEAIAAQLEESPSEQLNLYEEIALMRAAAAEAVKLYSAAVAANEEAPSDKRQAMALQAAAIMQQSLHEVVRICEAASRIEANAKDKISVGNLSFFVDKLMNITYNTLGTDEAGQAQCARLEQELRAHVRIPLSQGTLLGTVVTPDSTDAIVADMDSTVPNGTVDVLPKLAS